MVKITKGVVEAAEAQEKDYLIWGDELAGFGLRVFGSGKRSYVIQYRLTAPKSGALNSKRNCAVEHWLPLQEHLARASHSWTLRGPRRTWRGGF